MSDHIPRSPVFFVVVGGFLGAGKTTALGAIGQRLSAAGRQVAMLTNDQADDLVDTGMAGYHGLPVREVANGCFCCRFQDVIDRCDEILEAVRPDVLLAEPVGTCADLAATVLQPLKHYYGDRFRVGPFTVLVDLERFRALRDGPRAASPVGYLYRKQLEEGDLLVLTKADLLSADERAEALAGLAELLPATDRLAMSAVTGEGLDAWWGAVETGHVAGQRILDLDYAIYGAGEEVLTGLNAAIELTADEPFDGEALVREIVSAIRHGAVRRNVDLWHVKLLLEAPPHACRLGLTRATGPIEQTGALPLPVTAGDLTLNARLDLPPEDLEALVLRALRRACNERRVAPTITRLRSWRPKMPQPTHRFTAPGRPGQA